MAHIIAAANRGPRADASKSAAEKGAFENLVMLCTACHTMIDQAPADFPDALIVQWKYEHTEKLKAIFGVVRCASRQEARAFITPLLAENHAIFEDCGPHKAIGGLADLELASKWLVRMRTNIIPNNRKALAILDANRDLLSEDECQILEQFRLHTEDLEARHLTDTITGGQRRFPDDMATILVGER
ncbi:MULTISPECIES: hypothetical protein [unclassified Beijerinckia]|uniref:hypothetical protein n=1 Tax=unclassified Beijerinckia TaxID=2638183 RepID=UPI001114D70F|nr:MULTISPECIES: hypothetical protein [unclassified Beijerinckia]